MRNIRKKRYSAKYSDDIEKIHITPAYFFEQQLLRKKISQTIPQSIRPIEDSNGADFFDTQSGATIDQKFSFGGLGENKIRIRTVDRRLLNNSDYTMIINRDETLHLFQTTKLAEFVKGNWGIVQKGRLHDKRKYVEYKIDLFDLYRTEQIIPSIIKIAELERISEILAPIQHYNPIKLINTVYFEKLANRLPQEKQHKNTFIHKLPL